MRDQFKKAAEAYHFPPNEDGQYSISRTDAEILDVITSIGKLMNNRFYELLRQYKVIEDTEVLNMLQQYLDNYVDGSKRIFIDVGPKKEIFEVKYILSFTSCDTYQNNRPTYKLIINEGANERILYNNHEVLFNTPIERDEELIRLKTKLENNTKVVFL